MSTYDDASLVMIPSGYKTGTVFSQKPMSTDGQLTFTRSNDTATRVASNGLIEKVRTNLVPNGLLFNSATGVLYTTEPSNTPISGTLRYGQQVCSTPSIASNTIHTISRFFKYDGFNTTTSLEFNNGAQWGVSWRQDIDIASTGITLQAPSNCTSKITNVGSGWYRVDVTIATGTVTVGGPATYLLKVASALSTGEGFLTAAPQLETGDIATDYIPTTTAAVSVGPVANVPRLDYLGSTCPRLLLEPSRANLVIFSENLDNASWTKIATTATANTTTSPDGTLSADTILANGASGLHAVQTNAVSYTSGTAASFSIFAKKGTNDFMQLAAPAAVGGMFANFDLNTGVVGTLGTTSGTNPTSSITDYGNGWYRCVINFTPNATSASVSNVAIVSSASAVRVQSNSLATSIILWGCQIETSAAYATSYIPTLGAAVSRGADSGCNKTGISSLIGQAEGTLFVEVDLTLGRNNTGAGNGMLEVLDSGRANAVTILKSSTVNQILIALRVNSVNTFITAGAYISGTNKIAVAYKSGQNVCYVNGVLAATSSLSFTFSASVDAVNVGAYTTNVIDDRLSQALLFKTRLDNATLASLTTL